MPRDHPGSTDDTVLAKDCAARDADTAEASEVLDAAEWPVLNNSVRHLVAIRRSFGRAPLPEALAEYRPVVAEILELLDGEA